MSRTFKFAPLKEDLDFLNCIILFINRPKQPNQDFILLISNLIGRLFIETKNFISIEHIRTLIYLYILKIYEFYQLKIDLEREFRRNIDNLPVFSQVLEFLENGSKIEYLLIFCGNSYLKYQFEQRSSYWQLNYLEEFTIPCVLKKDFVEGVKINNCELTYVASVHTNQGQHLCIIINKSNHTHLTYSLQPGEQQEGAFNFIQNLLFTQQRKPKILDSFVHVLQNQSFLSLQVVIEDGNIQNTQSSILRVQYLQLGGLDKSIIVLKGEQKFKINTNEMSSIKIFSEHVEQNHFKVSLFYFEVQKSKLSYKMINYLKKRFEVILEASKVTIEPQENTQNIFNLDNEVLENRSILNQAHKFDSIIVQNNSNFYGIIRIGSVYQYFKSDEESVQVNVFQRPTLGLGFLKNEEFEYVTLAFDDMNYLIERSHTNKEIKKYNLEDIMQRLPHPSVSNSDCFNQLISLWQNRQEITLQFSFMEETYDILDIIACLQNFAYNIINEQGKGLKLILENELQLDEEMDDPIILDFIWKQEELNKYLDFLVQQLNLRDQEVYQPCLNYVVECLHKVQIALSIRRKQNYYSDCMYQCLERWYFNIAGPVEQFYLKIVDLEFFIIMLLDNPKYIQDVTQFLNIGHSLLEENPYLVVEWWTCRNSDNSILNKYLSVAYQLQKYQKQDEMQEESQSSIRSEDRELVLIGFLEAAFKEILKTKPINENNQRQSYFQQKFGQLENIYFDFNMQELFCELLTQRELYEVLFNLYIQRNAGIEQIDRIITVKPEQCQIFVRICIEAEKERMKIPRGFRNFKFLSMISDFKNRNSINQILETLQDKPEIKFLASLHAGRLQDADQSAQNVSFDSHFQRESEKLRLLIQINKKALLSVEKQNR